MPSFTHECLIELFRARPLLAAELLGWAGLLRVGEVREVKVIDSSLTVPIPTELRADGVIWMSGGEDLSAILEVQLRPDPQKRQSWPLYLASQHARRPAPSVILVVTLDEATASWAATPIHLGPGSVVTPVVFGPRQIPLLLDPKLARENPEATVLSALAHAKGPDAAEVSFLALQAVSDNPLLNEDKTVQYTEMLLSALSLSARALLEKRMYLKSFDPQTEYVKRWVKERKEREECFSRELKEREECFSRELKEREERFSRELKEREERFSREMKEGRSASPRASRRGWPSGCPKRSPADDERPKALAAEVAPETARAQHEEARRAALDIIAARFGDPSDTLCAQLSALSVEQLVLLRRPLVTLPSFDELPALLAEVRAARPSGGPSA
ncbi:MAG: hypothetical protein IPN01_18715 [Deltaproteobacteria bacterium]|nr:hypothetical protein [Deltaproteobacteria bacterium]